MHRILSGIAKLTHTILGFRSELSRESNFFIKLHDTISNGRCKYVLQTACILDTKIASINCTQIVQYATLFENTSPNTRILSTALHMPLSVHVFDTPPEFRHLQFGYDENNPF